MDERVVLSRGTLSALSAPELAAILGHERAHLRARHDLVLEAFIAVHTAFPRVVRSGSALRAVRLLVELLADDAAVRAAKRAKPAGAAGTGKKPAREPVTNSVVVDRSTGLAYFVHEDGRRSPRQM